MRLLTLAAVACLTLGCGDAGDDDHDHDTDDTDATDETDDTNDTDATDDIEAPSGCEVLSPYAGTYTVTGTPTGDDSQGPVTGEHERGTVVIGVDCAVDYDDGLTFTPADVQAIYDRTEQEHSRRVQVSYGADDDGPVINVYLTDALEVYEIQYRHRDDGVNLRVLVE